MNDITDYEQNYRYLVTELRQSSFPNNSGVYLMLDEKSTVIYIGKAKNLKKRVFSYFLKTYKNPKTCALIKNIKAIDLILTRNEVESLLLEQNLIKQYQPKFNVLLRDDKAYPYIFLSNHKFPQVGLKRKIINLKHKKKLTLFGPYINSYHVRGSLKILQKIFKLRSCTDNVYNNRTNPCLKYQINFCSAPCVGYISQENYAKKVMQAKMFIRGQNHTLLSKLHDLMKKYSSKHDFENANLIKQKIIMLESIQRQKQNIIAKSIDLDIWVIDYQTNKILCYLLPINLGKVGRGKYFEFEYSELEVKDAFLNFLSQYYLIPNCSIPQQIILPEIIKKADFDLISQALTEKLGITIKFMEKYNNFLSNISIAKTNLSSIKLQAKNEINNTSNLLSGLAKKLNINQINKIECIDISHFGGDETVGSLVVYDAQGINKSLYRLYKIKHYKNDDYGSIQELINRRFNGKIKLPELIMIDGGIGQLKAVIKVINQVKLNKITLLAISKGKERIEGNEKLYLINYEKDKKLSKPKKINLKQEKDLFNLILQLRNEAHRFAIKNSRKNYVKKRTKSVLQDLNQVGKVRVKKLLNYFNSFDNIKNLTKQDLMEVPGIGEKLALKILKQLKEKYGNN